MTLKAVPAGNSSPWQVWPCRIGQGVEARKRTAPGPPGWGLGGGPITSLLKTKWITETLNTQRQPSLGANAVPWLNRQRMTPLSQSREDAQELNQPLAAPRTQIRIELRNESKECRLSSIISEGGHCGVRYCGIGPFNFLAVFREFYFRIAVLRYFLDLQDAVF